MNVHLLTQILVFLTLMEANAYASTSFSQIDGIAMQDAAQQKVGEVKDLVLDIGNARVVSVIVSGRDGEWHGVAPETCEFRPGHKILIKTSSARLPIQFSFPPGKWPTQEQLRSRLSVIPESRLQFGSLLRASELKGMRVTNFRDEHLGDIKDVTFNGGNGRIEYLLLSAGPWMGKNHRLLSIPSTLFMQHTDGKKLVLNADKNRLKHAAAISTADLTNTFWGANQESTGTNSVLEKRIP